MFGRAPLLAINPASLAFGSINLGQSSAAQTVTVNNSGSANLLLGALAVSGVNAGEFLLGNDTCSSQTVAPAASCTFAISFSPTATGARAAQVDIPSNAPSSPDAVDLTGTGVSAMIVIMPSKLDFGEQPLGAMSDSQMVVIENTGTADLVIDPLIVTGANSDNFSIGMDNCSGQTLGTDSGVDNFCGVEISFQPASPGIRRARLQITSNDANSPGEVELRGTNNVQFADGFEDP